MKNVLIATAIAITSLSAMAQTPTSPSANGELGYSAAAPQTTAPSGSKGNTSVLGASAASRQTAPGLTRAQVRAELEAALRNGEVVSGELGTVQPAGTGSWLAGR